MLPATHIMLKFSCTLNKKIKNFIYFYLVESNSNPTKSSIWNKRRRKSFRKTVTSLWFVKNNRYELTTATSFRKQPLFTFSGVKSDSTHSQEISPPVIDTSQIVIHEYTIQHPFQPFVFCYYIILYILFYQVP